MVFTDQLGRNIEIDSFPERIVSLVPSQTELLFDLGLNERVVGITKFCVHPQEWFATKQRVGGTKNINIDIIHSLKPDLVLANKEENVKEQIELVEKDYPVWISDVHNLTSALHMIECIGALTNKIGEAYTIKKDIERAFSQLAVSVFNPFTIAYLIWREPYMTVGGDTFINNMLELCHFRNVFAGEVRYPPITIQQIQDKKPQLVLLSSEPYPFTEKHIAELSLQIPHTKFMLVNGEMFSWYGSRLQFAANYFKRLQEQVTHLFH